MRLAVDASTLVGEALGARGRVLLKRLDLDLALASEVQSETAHQLQKRAAQLPQGGLLLEARAAQLVEDALALIAARLTVVQTEVCAARHDEAQWLAGHGTGRWPGRRGQPRPRQARPPAPGRPQRGCRRTGALPGSRRPPAGAAGAGGR